MKPTIHTLIHQNSVIKIIVNHITETAEEQLSDTKPSTWRENDLDSNLTELHWINSTQLVLTGCVLWVKVTSTWISKFQVLHGNVVMWLLSVIYNIFGAVADRCNLGPVRKAQHQFEKPVFPIQNNSAVASS